MILLKMPSQTIMTKYYENYPMSPLWPTPTLVPPKTRAGRLVAATKQSAAFIIRVDRPRPTSLLTPYL